MLSLQCISSLCAIPLSLISLSFSFCQLPLFLKSSNMCDFYFIFFVPDNDLGMCEKHRSDAIYLFYGKINQFIGTYCIFQLVTAMWNTQGSRKNEPLSQDISPGCGWEDNAPLSSESNTVVFHGCLKEDGMNSWDVLTWLLVQMTPRQGGHTAWKYQLNRDVISRLSLYLWVWFSESPSFHLLPIKWSGCFLRKPLLQCTCRAGSIWAYLFKILMCFYWLDVYVL